MRLGVLPVNAMNTPSSGKQPENLSTRFTCRIIMFDHRFWFITSLQQFLTSAVEIPPLLPPLPPPRLQLLKHIILPPVRTPPPPLQSGIRETSFSEALHMATDTPTDHYLKNPSQLSGTSHSMRDPSLLSGTSHFVTEPSLPLGSSLSMRDPTGTCHFATDPSLPTGI